MLLVIKRIKAYIVIMLRQKKAEKKILKSKESMIKQEEPQVFLKQEIRICEGNDNHNLINKNIKIAIINDNSEN